ncbi:MULTISPECIES: helix-turn-helix domain-containing protein [Nostoc]|uniref:Helix-turn-helix domain-containing protein n=2 Tax=Nostoc TaxID=1177 RepID=A0ABR8I328_9NOSO|nr:MULTISPECIES: helix-turn-helix domain-containing protein [Nostoc]MBD2559854.1 helix-turn-helix domain-containing protein [Nostoc linckia FACHB-391]MBD2645182.1 helix-turn-helix domain-containing protein [Nostoc foliaceum FACHB-393]
MSAPLRVKLTDLTLLELRSATTVPQRTRERAHIIRLNAQGWNVPAIAKIFVGLLGIETRIGHPTQLGKYYCNSSKSLLGIETTLIKGCSTLKLTYAISQEIYFLAECW